MIIQIPTRPGLPAYTMTVRLTGRVYLLRFRWNTRDESWSFDILLGDGTPLVEGIKIVPDWDLTGRFSDLDLPAGRFFAIDKSGRGERPGLDDLGDRVAFVFVTEDQVEAVLGG